MTATLDIRAPEDQTEGTRSQILRWLKAVGESVTEHEPLIEIETDKVTVEVAAPASGVLREIVKAEQEEIAPGDVLGRLEPVGSLAEATGGGQHNTPHQQASAPTAASIESAVPQAFEYASSDSGGSLPDAGASPPTEPLTATPGNLMRQSPAVRRLITERGLDPSTIQGTGDSGRITIDDVLAHKPLTPRSAAPSAPSSTAPLANNGAAERAGMSPATIANKRTVPHTAIRKRIANHMVQSLLHTAPHVTTVFEADLSNVMAHRTHHRADFEQRGAPLTYTAYFLAATVAAIRAVPEANSHWTDSSLEIYEDIHIGIATAIEGVGLMVPVLHNVESLELFDIALGLNRLVTAAREGTLEPSDVRNGTFTISNHGVSGSLLATPIVINQPQSAILGIGKVEKRPVVLEQGGEQQLVVRPKCYVTLTIDHRVMDGHQANHFLQTFVKTLEAWPAT